MSFALDRRIEQTSLLITQLDDFQIRLVNDKRYIWLLLVPALPDISELDDLTPEMQIALIRRASQLSSVLKSHFRAEKMNIATIGNIVPQFHLHMIARHITDKAWPQTVWGQGDAVNYDKDEAVTMSNTIKDLITALPKS